MHGTIRWPTRGARSGLGKLLCDARSEKLCLRCSGCDMVANKVVLTGLMHSVWFCRLWECNMAAFLNGIFQLLCVLCICALLEAGIFVPCIPLPRGHLAVSRDIILLLQLGVRRSGGYWVEPGMTLNTLQCTGQTPLPCRPQQ